MLYRRVKRRDRVLLKVRQDIELKEQDIIKIVYLRIRQIVFNRRISKRRRLINKKKLK